MKRQTTYWTIIVLTVLCLVQGCVKDPLPNDFVKPSITTIKSSVSYNTATLTCSISRANYKECGFYYGTKNDLSDKRAIKASQGNDKKSAEAVLSNLELGKTYYYQAYVNGGRMEVTSGIYSFKTILPVSNVTLSQTSLTLNINQSVTLTSTVFPSNATDKTVTWTSSDNSIATVSNGTVTAMSAGTAIITAKAGSKTASCTVTVIKKSTVRLAVDLGLSVKWANINIGANAAEDYGDYYAWGETTTKSDYSWNTYKWCKGTYDSLTKYNTNSSYGTVDNKTRLDLSDDVARSKWGGKWRMPTKEECDELRTKCSWTWTSQGGKNGYRVTGPNGNSIFLPAAGYRYVTSVILAGSNGDYLSSSLFDPYNAWFIGFSTSEDVDAYGSGRCVGFSVRPVTE